MNTISDTTLDSKAKTPIHFMHASPGIGITPFFLEMVKIGVDKQKSYLSKCDFLNKKISMEKKEALLDDILHIAVSFNGRTTYKPKHMTMTTKPEILSHITLRIMHIWLSKVSLTDDMDRTRSLPIQFECVTQLLKSTLLHGPEIVLVVTSLAHHCH